MERLAKDEGMADGVIGMFGVVVPVVRVMCTLSYLIRHCPVSYTLRVVV